MSRVHMHVVVEDLETSIRFYTALFGAEPSLVEADYAKWELDEPHINFDISTRGQVPGLDHVGIQLDTDRELNDLQTRLEEAGFNGVAQQDTACCYEHSNKYWILDPTYTSWEAFHSLRPIATFNGKKDEQNSDGCCDPFTGGSSCFTR
ncbi:MAG: ArsI/CadI family heavy metal resistance metalloenzyme [Pseudomonadota bacterium]|nr:ArsI/CadI family heavy metal resistance metalloenzyme [Pseudomonadota bacterium]